VTHGHQDIRATGRIALTVNVLILGGTRFLGRHLVDELRARGHNVTLFNSGSHRNNAPAEVTQVHGDREKDLARLEDGPWDSVIDTCGFFPNQVEVSAAYLRGRTAQYVFVSSISALDLSGQRADDETPTLSMPDGASRTEMTPETYGALKAACEKAITNVFGEGSLIARPGLIVGPYDPTDRFTYWPSRIIRGGDVLAPVGPRYFVQFIDARDLAAWIVVQVERQTSGAVNVTGAPRTILLDDVLRAAARVATVHPNIRYADESFLKEHEIGEWIDLPLWVASSSEFPGILNIDTKRAFEMGLQIRPLEQTVRDTLAWSNSREPSYEWKAGLTPEREAEVLSHLA